MRYQGAGGLVVVFALAGLTGCGGCKALDCGGAQLVLRSDGQGVPVADNDVLVLTAGGVEAQCLMSQQPACQWMGTDLPWDVQLVQSELQVRVPFSSPARCVELKLTRGGQQIAASAYDIQLQSQHLNGAHCEPADCPVAVERATACPVE